MTLIQRMFLARRAVAGAFGLRLAPFAVGLAFFALTALNRLGMAIDPLLSPALRRARVRAPIVIVGNPRTGTTFLQRFLHEHGFAAGLQLYRMVHPSLLVQRALTPWVPWLESVSPARHHRTAAHDTDLLSVETDDVAALFQNFDGFFIWAFFLAHDDEDHLPLFDPSTRDTSRRDFDHLEAVWRRSMAFTGRDRIVAKLFSTSTRLPVFLQRFPDARILYMARDPVAVIPSALSLVTGVQDSAFGFWKLPEDRRRRYLERLYQGLIELLRRFHEDWTSGAVDRSRVHIVRYDRLMADFEGEMDDICRFADLPMSPAQRAVVRATAEKQRAYRSSHRYDLEKYGLTVERIRADTAFFRDTFL